MIRVTPVTLGKPRRNPRADQHRQHDDDAVVANLNAVEQDDVFRSEFHNYASLSRCL
jgi:hypothetical protein